MSASPLAAIRRHAFGASVLILVQLAIGIDANLFVVIPHAHSGAHPSNYVTGSLASLGWAMSHGGLALAIHTVIGLVLAVFVVRIVFSALALGRRAINVAAVLGALFTIGAGFNGASFLDYQRDVSSLIMALLAFAALLCFITVLYLGSEGDLRVARGEPEKV